jgi:hypothetical protein
VTLREFVNALCALGHRELGKDVIADGKLVASVRVTENRVVVELVDREDVVS